jgi:hypothetical protein
MALTLGAETRWKPWGKRGEIVAQPEPPCIEQKSDEAAQLLRCFRFESYHAAPVQLFGAACAFRSSGCLQITHQK